MQFSSNSAYKLAAITSCTILVIAYAAGILLLGTQSSSGTVGDNIAVLAYAVVLTPGTILVIFKQKWAAYPLIILYILTFFTVITLAGAACLIYAVTRKKQ